MKLAPNTAEEKPPLKKIKHIFLNRNQLSWMMLDLEHLIGADHPARVMISLLVYGYSLGVPRRGR